MNEFALVAVLRPSALEEVIANCVATPGICESEVVAFLLRVAEDGPIEGADYPPQWWANNLRLRAQVVETVCAEGAAAATEWVRQTVLWATGELLDAPSWEEKERQIWRLGYLLLDPLAPAVLREIATVADERGHGYTAIELRQHAVVLARLARDGNPEAIAESFRTGEDPGASPRLLAAFEALVAEPTDAAAAAFEAELRESEALPGSHLRMLSQIVPELRDDPPLARLACAQIHPHLGGRRYWEALGAELWFDDGEPLEALAAFDRLVELGGLDNELLAMRSQVLAALISAADCKWGTGTPPDELEAVLSYRERLLEDPSLDAMVRSGSLIDLAGLYHDRGDLDTAVARAEAAVELAPPEREQQARAMLGRMLMVRAQRTDRGEDIQRAVESLTRALELSDPADPSVRAPAHNDLGAALMKQLEVGVLPGWDATVDERERRLVLAALDQYSRAASLRSGDRHADAAHLANKAQALGRLNSLDGDPEPLERAIEAARAAIAIADPVDPILARWKATLAELLMRRGDATEAHALLDGVVAPEPQDAIQLALLRANAAAEAAAANSSPPDAVSASFRKTLELPGPPAYRLQAAARWGRWAADAGRDDDVVSAYSRVPGLMRELAQAQTAYDDLLRVAGRFRGLADRAAQRLAAAGHIGDAVAALDAGRAVALRRQLGRFAPDATPQALERAAAVGHPVVFLSVAEDRGGAIVVDRGREIFVPLPRLSDAALRETGRAYLLAYQAGPRARLVAIERVCLELWDVVLGPIVAAIDIPDAMTLVPASMLTMLPLHAACTLDGKRRRYLLDSTTVSVVPNSDALERGLASPLSWPPRETLLVVDPQPSTAPSLPGAGAESGLVRRLLQPAECSGEGATKAGVLAQIATPELVHFACHGVADPADPLASAVLLADDERLEARDLAAVELNARLVILAACETAFPGLLLPEEAIGFPTSLLAGGATSVIASLWPVVDWSTAELMCRLHLALDAGRPAVEALREAQLAVRDTTVAEKRAFLNEYAGVEDDLWPLESAATRPYVRPYFWAGFFYTGGFQTVATSGDSLSLPSA